MARTTDTKERLVAAALELIEQSSFGAVSVDLICERADVRKGSFYHYFPSKVDLAIEAFETAWRTESKPLFERVFRPEVPPLQRLLDLCSEWYAIEAKWFADTGHVRGCPFCTVGSEMANQDVRLREKAEELIERDLVHIENALREAHAAGQIPATDFRVKTRAIAALLLGTKLQAKLQNDPRALRDVGRQVLDFVGARLDAVVSTRTVSKRDESMHTTSKHTVSKRRASTNTVSKPTAARATPTRRTPTSTARPRRSR